MSSSLSGLALLQCYSDSDSEHEEPCDVVTSEKSHEKDETILCKDNEVIAVKGEARNNVSISAFQSEEDSSVQIFQRNEDSTGDLQSGKDEIHGKIREVSEPCSEQSTPVHPSTEDRFSNQLEYRVNESSDSESESSDDSHFNPSVVSVVDVPDEDDEDGGNDKETKENRNKSKMLEALGIVDLPPIEDLTIAVPQEECIPMGKIFNIIDSLVIIMANKGTPAIDLDSVLFLEKGSKTLGRVFDVFGPVSEPMYMVRFNTPDDIVSKEIATGLEVYYAPRTHHTAFVFLEPLIKMRGSDASWEHDMEPPENCLDYSDDEEERKAKAAQRMKKSGANPTTDQEANPRRNKRQKSNNRPNRNQLIPPNPFYMRAPTPSSSAISYGSYGYNPATAGNLTNYPPGNPWSAPPPPMMGFSDSTWAASSSATYPHGPYVYNSNLVYPPQFRYPPPS